MRSLLAVFRGVTAATGRPLGRLHVRCGLTCAVVLGAALTGLSSPATAAAACDLTATTATFGSEVTAASPGQTVCLTTGDYGSWRGTNKAITVTAAPGNTPTMQVDFASGAAGFTLDGMSGVSGTIDSGAANITIQNSTFAQQLVVEGSVTNIVVNHNNLTYAVQSVANGANSKIFLDTNGGAPGSAVTIENNDIENGDLDGVNIATGNGAAVVGNYFANLCDRNVNHTDNIQFEGGTGTLIARNYVYEAQSCPTQGITAYDGGIHDLLIEDNVVDIPRDWGIELYSDQGSTVVHNTVVWHPRTYSEFHTTGGTGQIILDRKSQDPAGSGTQVYDNIATSVDIGDGSTGNAYDNVSGQRAVYVGPSTTWAGYALAASSPVGLHAASDGLNDGIRVSPSPQAPSPQPGQTTTGPAKQAPSPLVVTGFRFAPSRFALAHAASRGGSRVKRGTSIRFKLSAAAKVTISVARVLAGRRSAARCVAPTRKLAKHRACSRYHHVGSITVERGAGNRSVAFTGRLGRRWLALGHYRATIVAKTADGRRSAPRTAAFTIA